MNRLDEQYRGLLAEVLYNGNSKDDRTGTGTLSRFGMSIRHRMKDGFPLLTTKKMAIKSIMTELKWFLKGDTNIKYLLENNCHIWNGDAYKHFRSRFSPMPGIQSSLPTMEEFIEKIKTSDSFAERWGELGPIYGKQWREWAPVAGEINKGGKDQIKELIEELKTNPDSRRLMVSAWNVSELPLVVLPPCHYGFQVYTRELTARERIELAGGKIQEKYPALIEQSLKVCDERNIPTRAISLMWNQRSVDTFLGLPFNIASYGMLLELIAKEVNMVPDELIGNLGDVHLYSNHIEQAKEQISREPYKLPTIELSNVDILNGGFDYKIKNYQSHPTIKAPLSN